MKKIIIYGFVFLMLLSSVFAFQWYETFETNTTDQLNLNDTGATAWSSTAPLTFFQHRIGNTSSPSEYALITSNDIKETPTRFESEVFDISQASGDLTISFIVGTLDLRDKLSANTKIFVYSKIDGAMILETTIVEGQLSKEILDPTLFQLTRDSAGVTYQLIIDFQTEKPEEVFYFDNLLIEYLNASEISTGEITISIANNNSIIINTTILNNLTTIVNTTITPIIIINTGNNDTFDGFSNFGDIPAVCPLNEGNTDRSFYMYIMGFALILFIFAFWIDNAMFGILASLLFMYIAFISVPCNVFISGMLILFSLVGLLLSITQLEFTAT